MDGEINENTFIIIQTPTQPTSGLVQSQIKSHAMRFVHRRKGASKARTLQHKLMSQQLANGTSDPHLPGEDQTSARFWPFHHLNIDEPSNQDPLLFSLPYNLNSWAECTPEYVAMRQTANMYSEYVDEPRQQLDGHYRATGERRKRIHSSLVTR